MDITISKFSFIFLGLGFNFCFATLGHGWSQVEADLTQDRPEDFER